MKRVLSLIIALMLVLSSVAFSEDAFVDEVAIDDAAAPEAVVVDGDLSIEGADLFGEGVGDIDLGDLLDTGLVSNAPESPRRPPLSRRQPSGTWALPSRRTWARSRPGPG